MPRMTPGGSFSGLLGSRNVAPKLLLHEFKLHPVFAQLKQTKNSPTFSRIRSARTTGPIELS